MGAQRLQAELWWDLNGDQKVVAMRLLPLLADELAPGSTRCAPWPAARRLGAGFPPPG